MKSEVMNSAPSMTSQATSTTSSTALSTPESSETATLAPEREGTPLGLSEKFKGMMLPPPIPATSVVSPTPPRMTRLPSLRELSNRLHLHIVYPPPSPDGASSTSSVPVPPSYTNGDKPVTPPRPSLLPDPSHLAASPRQSIPLAPSPSSRLRLPPSAMTRSKSASSSVPTLDSLRISLNGAKFPAEGSKGESSRPSTPKDMISTDPFASSATPLQARDLNEPNAVGMSRGLSRDGFIQGYKDVPSLAAIRERVTISRTKGSAGSASEIRENPKVEDLIVKAAVEDGVKVVLETREGSSLTAEAWTSQGDGQTKSTAEHSLKHTWTLYYDSKTYKPDPALATPKEGEPLLGDYELSLLTVGTVDTVESFARHMNNIRLPSLLARNANYHMFKDGIRPMWEDPANAHGGKWVVLFRSNPHLLDMAWANLTMALVGEELDPDNEVCGVVASNKPRADRIQIWTRGRDDVDRVNALGKRIIETMGLEGREVESMSMEFQYNATNSIPHHGQFLQIAFPPQRNSFSHAPPTPSRLTHGVATSGHIPSPLPSPSPLSTRFPFHTDPAGSMPPPRSPNMPSGSLVPPGTGERPEMRRMGSGQGIGAFAGPIGGGAMGGGVGRASLSGRAVPVPIPGIGGR